MTGASAMPSAAVTTRARNSSVATASTSPRTSSGARFLCSARIGTKACEKAPSPNMRRSRLGILKATKKASVTRLAPKMRAMKKSRTKPSTRLTMVKLLTVARALRRFMCQRAFMVNFAPSLEDLNGQHQIGAQARHPGEPPPRAQRQAAHRGSHRDQERDQGGRRGQEGRRRQGAARLAAH